ncbi:MAG: sigma 54-interacting transcriptional regulator, partial [Desulfobacterales bacterium]|nr:sigma 54-interacting transcriptional regulator [Desulfobacterales bacterium]
TFRGLIITATNSELEKAVTAGEFREDLYYRLNVVPLVVPPLRDRDDDIRLISQYYIDHFADKFGKHRLSFSPNARAALDEYPWPGNVRELKNMMEMLAVMCDGPEISLPHLPPVLSSGAAIRPEEAPPTISLPRELSDASLAEQMAFLESRIIDRALEKSNGVKTEAASILGISRFTLLRRIKYLEKEVW